MRPTVPAIVLSACVTCLLLTGCGRASDVPTREDRPAKIEQLSGADPTRVTLTEEAAKRIGLETVAATEGLVETTPRVVVPYSAILYDTEGATWTYVASAPFTYVRHGVKVDRITGDQAFLADGLTKGTAVVSVGAEELFGSETEFEEE